MNPFAAQAHMPTASGRKVLPAYIEKAEKHRKRGELDKALEACERVVSECPGYVSGHIALARVRLDMGDSAAAQEALNAAISLDPMNPVAQNMLAKLDLASGLRDKATKRIRDILFFYPNDVEAAALLAQASLAEQSRQSTETAAAPPAPTKALAEVAQSELETLRTTAGITGAMVIDDQGLPVWGSLGRGERTDDDAAAKVSTAVQVWRATWAQAGMPSRAIVESPESRLVVAPCGECVLVVALSPRIRAGRVLGIIDRTTAKMRAAGA